MSVDRIVRELERIKRLLASLGVPEAYESIEEPSIDVREGAINPLYSLEAGEDYYRIVVDLPVAAPDTIKVYTEGDYLVIEASLEREVTIETPWDVERRFVARKYKRKIPLPLDADPGRMQVRVHPQRKMVEIIIPRV